MAKKSMAFSGDRTDPKANKSLAIRTVLKGMPRSSKASEVAAEVKKQFGHTVSVQRIYMAKAKKNIRRRAKAAPTSESTASSVSLSSPVMWVDAIKLAKQLLAASGSAANAMALIKAVDA